MVLFVLVWHGSWSSSVGSVGIVGSGNRGRNGVGTNGTVGRGRCGGCPVVFYGRLRGVSHGFGGRRGICIGTIASTGCKGRREHFHVVVVGRLLFFDGVGNSGVFATVLSHELWLYPWKIKSMGCVYSVSQHSTLTLVKLTFAKILDQGTTRTLNTVVTFRARLAGAK